MANITRSQSLAEWLRAEHDFAPTSNPAQGVLPASTLADVEAETVKGASRALFNASLEYEGGNKDAAWRRMESLKASPDVRAMGRGIKTLWQVDKICGGSTSAHHVGQVQGVHDGLVGLWTSIAVPSRNPGGEATVVTFSPADSLSAETLQQVEAAIAAIGVDPSPYLRGTFRNGKVLKPSTLRMQDGKVLDVPANQYNAAILAIKDAKAILDKEWTETVRMAHARRRLGLSPVETPETVEA